MKTRMQNNARKSKGLILLIVLGMIAMFSLLAVTYVVSAGASRDASFGALRQARNSRFTVENTAIKVMKSALHGTNDLQSPFYKNDLIGDVYGSNFLQTSFHSFNANSGARLFASATITEQTFVLPTTTLVKVTLNPNALSPNPLSPLENEYNSRILTVLEGPLAGQSFRILKYVGHIRSTAFPLADPNVETTPWSTQTYVDANAELSNYSVLIDLNEAIGSRFQGQFYSSGRLRTISLALPQWIATQGLGLDSLFYQPRLTAASPWEGFRVLINDAPFNSPGIGVEEVASIPDTNPMNPPVAVPGFGNIDSRRLLAIPSNRPKVSPAILPDYDYLKTPGVMAPNPLDGGRVGVDGINIPRTNNTQFRLSGSSNEGYDVPDYRDAWLGFSSYVDYDHDNNPATPLRRIQQVKPSYHQPAVVQYLANLFGTPSSMTFNDVRELLQLIDMSSSRVMSYLGVNEGFNQNVSGYPRLLTTGASPFTWSTPPTAIQIAQLQDYVRKQIVGPWDVDNDGDGEADSVWIDPGLPVVFSPEGRRLKPLAAMMILDLDGRVNINAVGDRLQGFSDSFAFSPAGLPFKTPGKTIPNGFGYGPAEISLASLFAPIAVQPVDASAVNNLLRSQTNFFSFFDDRYGARRSPFANSLPINYALGWDLNPGLPTNAFGGNDIASVHGERELNVLHPSRFISGTPSNLAAAPALFGSGLPMLRRGEGGVAFDSMGNPTVVVSASGQPARDTINDPYESAVSSMPNHDDPLSLAELEAVLRQFDQDAKGLPDRLKRYLDRAGFVTNDIVADNVRRAITTRSGELRYPNLAAVSPVGTGMARTVDHRTPSMSRYVQWLHHQRYRYTLNAIADDDPDLSNAAIAELFPMDFFKGLRMDLNQPFGDGFDNDDDGAVDDPQELQQNYLQVTATGTGFEQEYHRPYESLTKSADGAYLRTIQWNPPIGSAPIRSLTRQRLGARQLLARNLYCLAQLIVPREHNFPGMASMPARDGSNNPIAANVWPRAQIRARALAQWAVNVVDFRDTDAAMTRFEYDILPFGIGADFVVAGIAARPAYWAPDRIVYSVNGIPNKTYTGVVWGMEMPEVLLSETLAFHDKRVRNTDMDDGPTTTKQTIAGDNTSDPHFDQFRFPQASLFIELTCPRTTESRANVLLPKVPTGLYTVDGVGNVALDLGRLAPVGTWGAQPVWRVAISQDYGVAGVPAGDHPNARLATPPGSGFELITHQQVYGVGSTTAATAKNGMTLATAANSEQYIGNGLVYNLADPTALPPAGLTGFERFVWFTPKSAFGGATPFPTNIPDLLAGTDAVHSVYNPDATNTLLHGGEFLVVGPRSVTSIGSLTHNTYSSPIGTPALYPSILTRLTAGGLAWRLTPSFQRIDLSGGTVVTYKTDGSVANQRFLNDSKAPRSIICTTPVPSDPAAPATQNWNASFGTGVGVNISYPTPVNSTTPTDYWYSNAALPGAPRAKRPFVSLNSTDLLASRPDNTPGYGDVATNRPDSFCDLSTIEPTDTFPDRPFDIDNPYIGIAGRYATGTYENVRVAYLQRLADPEFPYEPFSNPYITVDWMGIDLTVFNGESAHGSETGNGDATFAAFTDPLPNPVVNFHSRYKNGTLVGGGSNGVSYHSPVVSNLRTTPAQPAITRPGANPVVYNYESYFTRMLGYDAAITWDSAAGNNPQASGTTLGYANVGFDTDLANLTLDTSNTATYDGFGRPFSSAVNAYNGVTTNLQNLVWYNRTFATPYELALVPSSNPGTFGYTYSGFTTNERHPYQTSVPSQPLVNFGFIPSFQATNAWSTVNTPATHARGYWAASNPAVGTSFEADWPLMFELLETQAPYIDANRHLPPDEIMALSIVGSTPGAIASAARFLNSYIDTNYSGLGEPPTTRGPSLLAPYNKLPSFVAAGKINLNTISLDLSLQSKALQALEFAYTRGTNVATFFENFRHGYDPATAPANQFFGERLPHFHPQYPTQFVGAYRPAMSSNFAPPNPATPANEGSLRGRWGLESSLMRTATYAALTNSAPALAADPLLFNDIDAANTADATGDAQPFDRFRRVMRLPNLVTNQSNNFAVWVTVSLFEYDPITEFGNEYIGPSGTPVRDREFFIIDRTLPVGYKPGENLNTDRTILHKSKIQ